MKRLQTLWHVLRALTRDDAYERYLKHHARAQTGACPLGRREFYLNEQQRKWTGVSRCC